MIRVLLVEDQALIRRGIADLINLTPDLRVVAEAEDGPSAVALLAQEDLCDVVMLDIRCRGCRGWNSWSGCNPKAGRSLRRCC